MKRLLAADDDPAIRALLADYLGREDFAVTTAADGAELLRAFDDGPFDLVLLDVRMPGEDGFALARRLRARSTLPIIMLTGQGEEIDRVLGLELGADDYLTKPFSPRELLARIRAVLRRHELAAVRPSPVSPSALAAAPAGREARAYRFAGWTLDLAARHLLSPAGREVPLTNAEFELLLTLARAPRVVLSRDRLVSATHDDATVYDRSVDVLILKLRRKIEALPNNPVLIRARRGVGYYLDADVAVTWT